MLFVQVRTDEVCSSSTVTMSAISTYLYGKIPETEEMAKKEKSRAKFSQKTLIHIIPFALSCMCSSPAYCNGHP